MKNTTFIELMILGIKAHLYGGKERGANSKLQGHNISQTHVDDDLKGRKKHLKYGYQFNANINKNQSLIWLVSPPSEII